jgi:hypothetical protein
MLQRIPEHFQRLQKPFGSCMQHECNMDAGKLRMQHSVGKGGNPLPTIAKDVRPFRIATSG